MKRVFRGYVGEGERLADIVPRWSDESFTGCPEVLEFHYLFAKSRLYSDDRSLKLTVIAEWEDER